MIDAQELADRMMVEILADMAVGHVPEGVSSFSKLHDYVDANEYGSSLLEAYDSSDVELYAEAQEIVDRRLAARRGITR